MRSSRGSALGAGAAALIAATTVVVLARSDADLRALAGDGAYATTAVHAAGLLADARAPEETPAERRRRCRAAYPLPAPRSAVGLPPARIATLLKEAPETLGSAVIGGPTRGALFNGVLLEDSDAIAAVSPPVAWGTESTVASLRRAAEEVRCRFADTPTLKVGSLSRPHGGYLSPHRSHQAGLDADVGFYYRDGSSWYVTATEDNLDVARTWALVDALISQDNVAYVFVDRRLHPLLRAAAEAEPGERDLGEIFDGTPQTGGIIRHARGHDDHLHVRFRDPVAAANAGALLPFIAGRYRIR